MYKPEIGRLYKSCGGTKYYIIDSFENRGGSEEITIRFRSPGITQILEKKGIHNVGDFLGSIEPVLDSHLELEEITSEEIKLKKMLSHYSTIKEFLHAYAQSQPLCKEVLLERARQSDIGRQDRIDGADGPKRRTQT
jgi:hypothetical protein